MTRQELNEVLAAVSQMLQEQRFPVGEHGVTTPSWAPVDDTSKQQEAGTVGVTMGKTAAILGNQGPSDPDFDTGVEKPRLQVAVVALGEQYGPVGGERTVCIPTETGPIALFFHSYDDTPQAPAGESWKLHYDPLKLVLAIPQFVANAWRKFTNDGKVKGDNKGGYRLLVGGYGTFQTTNGFIITLDDTGKQLSVATPNGNGFIFDDATNTFQMQGSGNTADDGLVRKSDLRAAINALAASVGAGAGVAPPTITASTKSFTA